MYYILRNRFYNTEAVAFPMGEGDKIYRLNEEKLSTGWDIILVARVRSRNAGYSELERDFFSLCARLKLMAEEKDEKDTNMDSKIL